MENPSAVSSETPKPKIANKFLLLGIVVGFIYGISSFLLFFTFLPAVFIFLSIYIGTHQELMIVVTLILSTVSGGVAAFLSGRAAIRSANQSGSVWNAVIGTITSIVVAFIGLIVYFVLIYVIGSYIYSLYYEVSSGAGIFLLALAATLGAFLAYGTAVITGALMHYILAKRSARLLRNKTEIEEGVS